MANFLSLTFIFQGGNLNYGEGVATINALKRLSFKGKTYSYISRQALRYDIVRILNEEFKMPLTPVGSDGKVVQFEAKATIKDYPEIDLFGYMKTSGQGSRGNIRKAIGRLSDAISLEPWNNDMDFGNNMGLASRGQDLDNMIFQTEIHKSFYTYTLTLELDKVGIDGDIHLSGVEKKKRVNMLLDAIKILYRDIKGRREDLSPIFAIGGIYNSGNPFFYNKIALSFGHNTIKIKPEPINETLGKTYPVKNGENIEYKKVSDQTYLGVTAGIFSNIDEIKVKDEYKFSIENFFGNIKDNIGAIYR
ncbi:MAG: type I-B CRISPR-associated protein Cas7/Cst2/DevR [Spirochaetota bacterium]